MPAMIRAKDKATQIAHKVLGKPFGGKVKKTKKQIKQDARVLFEDTQRVR